MPRRITLSQVNERLVRQPASEIPAAPLNNQENLPEEVWRDHDEPIWSNIAFGLLTFLICLVLGGGVFFLMKDEPSAAFTSRIDAQCGEGWVAGLPNGKQLKCYLTVDVARLCDPRERKHLAGIIDKYSSDESIYDARFTAATLESMIKMQTGWAELGYKSAELQRATDAGADTAALDAEVSDMVGDFLREPERLQTEARRNHVPQHELVSLLRGVMKEGYLSRDDFGWYQQSMVNKALDGLTEVRPKCPS